MYSTLKVTALTITLYESAARFHVIWFNVVFAINKQINNTPGPFIYVYLHVPTNKPEERPNLIMYRRSYIHSLLVAESNFQFKLNSLSSLLKITYTILNLNLIPLPINSLGLTLPD